MVPVSSMVSSLTRVVRSRIGAFGLVQIVIVVLADSPDGAVKPSADAASSATIVVMFNLPG